MDAPSLRVLLVLCSAVAMATSAVPYKLEFMEEWLLWKDDHRRHYGTEEEETYRHSVWLSNKEYVDTHNSRSEEFGFTLRLNHFGDMTYNEYLGNITCYRQSTLSGHTDIRRSYNIRQYKPPGSMIKDNLPSSVDWRTKNAVTPVKNQGSCGACYAFGAVGALEGAHALAHDELVELSEQNIVDCSVPYGNDGCNGGNTYDTFLYVIDSGGIDTAASYHYEARQSGCRFNKANVGASEAGMVFIPSGREQDLMSAVATTGPVAVAVDGSSNAFRFYASGVFDEPNCSTTKLTNAMVIIGYDTFKNKPYWMVKNSWGTSWGQDGYIMMSRNMSNQCGIASAAAFPTL